MATRRRTQGSLIERAQTHDEARSSLPGEHWLALGAGIAAWALTRKSPSAIVRTAGMLAATALVGRAASGRDGLSKVLRFTPLGRRIR